MTALHPVLEAAAAAALDAYGRARRTHDRAALAETVSMGADGTPTMRIDELVEGAILAVVEGTGINLLSDSHRLVDLAAAVVLVEGAGGVVVDARGRPVELDTDLTRRWSGVVAATPQLAEELCAAISGP